MTPGSGTTTNPAPAAINSDSTETAATAGGGGSQLPDSVSSFETDLFSGSLNYQIPIVVAPARGSSQPKIALSYNSRNGNGWCGVGWSLEMGYIERDTRHGVPVLYPTDNSPPVQYDDSKGFVFSLNGMTSRLVPDPNTANLYHAHVEGGFLQFVRNGDAWTVTDKNGTIYQFGRSTDSQIQSQAFPNPNGTFRWALDRIVDANGNSTSLFYNAPADDPNHRYLSLITYNGTGDPSSESYGVQFTIEARTDDNSSLKSGIPIHTKYRLKQIDVYAGSASNLVRRYTLQYTPSGITNRSLLTTVTQLGNDGTSALPALTFTYQSEPTDGAFGFTDPIPWSNVNDQGDPDSYDLINANDGSNERSVGLIDMDRDGLPDRVMRSAAAPHDHFLVQRNLGLTPNDPVAEGSFAPPLSWGSLSNANGGGLSQGSISSQFLELITSSDTALLTDVYQIDLDGDGLPDRVLQDKAMSGAWYLQLSTTQSPNVPFDSHGPILLADSYDYIQRSDTTIITANYAVGTDRLDLIDMNGDGLPDRVHIDNSASFIVELNSGQFPASSNYPFGQVQRTWGTINRIYDFDIEDISTGVYKTTDGLYDMNGDGLPDLIHSGSGGSQGSILYNNGYGTGETVTIPALDSLHRVNSVGGTRTELVDMNGDGLLDLVTSNGTSTFNVRFGTGSGFLPAVQYNNVQASFNTEDGALDIQAKRGKNVELIDIDGDGLPDRVIAEYHQPHKFMVQLNKGPYPDLLVSVQNGIGGQITAAYTPSTRFDNHNAAGMGTLSSAMQVVTQIQKWDGISPTSQITSYSYQGGFYSYAQKEFRGFHCVRATNSSSDGVSGMTTKTYFHQGDPGSLFSADLGEGDGPADVEGTQGIPFRVDQFYGSAEGAGLYMTKLNHVVAHDAGNDNIFPYVDKSITRFYGGSGNVKDTAKEYVYDLINGNLMQTSDLGWVSVSNAASYQYSPVADVNNHPTRTNYTYNTTIPPISNRPATVKLYSVPADGSDAVLLRGMKMSYDGHGNLAIRWRYQDTASGYVQDLALSYDNYGNIFTQTDAAGVVTQTTGLDGDKMYPVAQTLGDHFAVSAAYDPRSGKATSTTDVTKLQTIYKYDAFYRLIGVNIIPPGGGKLRELAYGYSSGSATSNYVAKSIFYNDDKTANIQTANSIAIGPDPDAVVSIRGNALTTFSYSDGLGRPTQTRTLAEDGSRYRVIHTVYDDLGRKMFVSDPIFESGSGYTAYNPTPAQMAALGTVIQYDQFNRMTSVTPSSGDANSPTAPSSVTYNVNQDPWVMQTVDSRGTRQNTYHDAHGDIVLVTERPMLYVHESGDSSTNAIAPANAPLDTYYGYDALGQLISITNSVGHVTTIAYDSLGNKRQTVDPDMGTWNYTYDIAGRLRTQVDAKQQTTILHYGDGQYLDPNGSGRLTDKTFLRADGTQEKQVVFTYDTSQAPMNTDASRYIVHYGQLAEVQDNQGAEYYGYDNRGRLVTKSRQINVGMNLPLYTTTLAYDNASRVVSVGYPLGMATVNYNYDNAGNLGSVATPSKSTVFYSANTFDEFGDPRSETLGDGSTTTYTYYTGSKRLKSISTAVAQNMLQNLSYNYDQSGQITAIDDGVNASGPTSGAVSGVVYDNLYRMTSVTTAAQGAKNYKYDAIGRITQNGDASHTYTYDESSSHPQAFRSFNGIDYDYDANGNRISANDSSIGILSQYTYDTENQMVCLLKGPGGVVQAAPGHGSDSVRPQPVGSNTYFGYDFTGARLWKQNSAGAHSFYVDGLYEFRPVGSGKNLYHVYADGRLVCTYEPSQNVVVNFIRNDRLLARASTGLHDAIDWVFHTRERLDLTVVGCLSLFLVGFLVWLKVKVPLGTGQKQFQTRAGPWRWTNRLLSFSQQAVACVLVVALMLASANTAAAQGATYDPVFYFYHQDHLGSSTIITDRAGNTVQQYGYGPYGALNAALNSSAFPLSNLFTGQQYDDDTGLYYYGSRYYDPATATFVQPDTEVPDLFNPQSLNRYSYVLNNPLNLTDPSGHDPGSFDAQGFGLAQLGNYPGGGEFGYYTYLTRDLSDPGASGASYYATITINQPDPDNTQEPAVHVDPATPSSTLSNIGDYLTSAQGISTIANVASALPIPGAPAVFALIGAAAELYQGHYGAAALGVGGAVLGIVGAGGIVTGAKLIRNAVGIAKVAQEAEVAGTLAREAITVGAVASRSAESAALARTLGKTGEEAAGIIKNTERIESLTKTASYRIPDALNRAEGVLSEVKNVGSLSYTNQLRDFSAFAQQKGLRFQLTVRQTTKLSGPLQQAVDSGSISLLYFP